MILAGSEFAQEAEGEALDAPRVRTVRAGVRLAGVFNRFRAGHIWDARKRQEITKVGGVQKIRGSQHRALSKAAAQLHPADVP